MYPRGPRQSPPAKRRRVERFALIYPVGEGGRASRWQQTVGQRRNLSVLDLEFDFLFRIQTKIRNSDFLVPIPQSHCRARTGLFTAFYVLDAAIVYLDLML